MGQDYYAEGDGITARCHLCDVTIHEPLQGRVDPASTDGALSRAVTWMEAHMTQFHPDVDQATKEGDDERRH